MQTFRNNYFFVCRYYIHKQDPNNFAFIGTSGFYIHKIMRNEVMPCYFVTRLIVCF